MSLKMIAVWDELKSNYVKLLIDSLVLYQMTRSFSNIITKSKRVWNIIF